MTTNAAPSATEVLQLPAGDVQGRRHPGYDVFWSIPYAQDPTGRRRFRAPVPAKRWDGTRDATTPGPICPQDFDPIDAAMGASDQPQSETECLSLTVWRPSRSSDAAGLPVLVWIHGGALTSGASTWEQYSGHRFATDGVICVGINYRLGALGFLDLREHLTGEGLVANPGLHDALLALQWVQDNIAAFGGDPDQVTIFGESAGGAMVNALVASPLRAGLFCRAVMQSGTAVQLHEPGQAAIIVNNALKALNIAPGDERALQEVPVEQLLQLATNPTLMNGTDGQTGMPWLFTRDRHSLDLSGVEAIRAGRADGLELLIGWTVDEYRLRWLTRAPGEDVEPVDRLTTEQFLQAAQLYGDHMPGATAAEVAEKILNDQHFFAPAHRIAATHAHRGGRAWVYEFAWPSPALGGRLGACHALEIPFVFANPVAPRFHGDQPLPHTLIAAMHEAWLTFATTGEPATPGHPWPSYSTPERPVMVFDAIPAVIPDLDASRRSFWDAIDDEGIGIA